MMRPGLTLVLLAWAVVLAGPAGALDLDGLKSKLNSLTHQGKSSGSGLDQFSTREQVESLRQALTQGAETSVSTLAKKNGYLGNRKVRIPLPQGLQKADKVMRKVGMGKYSDELIVSMNRAAEAAVPEAKSRSGK